MKNSLAASTALAAVLALSPTAQAQGLYGSFFGGVNFLGTVEEEEFLPGYSYDYDFDTGFVVGGALGVELDGGLRIEGELAFRNNTMDQVTLNTPFGSISAPYDADAETQSLMANAWYDFELDGGFQPFIGGGVGLANIEIETVDDTVFAFQVGAGVAFPLSSGLSITGEYRYFQMSNASFFGLEEDIPGQHTFTAGVRVPF